jgi:2-polyprenyl-3-methyl-5-hydroxy-6-metoxy-1,4-benzoquinol methylase
MFLGDDTIPHPNFLYHAIVAMHKHFPDTDGLIGMNDLYWKGEFATHWLASKKLLPYLGGEFFHTGYNHLSCDNELTEMCRKIGKYQWAENSRVYHDHPGVHGWSDESYDKHYRRVYQFDTMRRDRQLLEARSKLLGFQITNGVGCSAPYPSVPECIDLRKRIVPNGKTALNVGVGPGTSWLAQQLPHLPFLRLDNMDVHKPYLDKAAEMPWAAGSVGFINGDITEFDIDGQYDTMLLFDVIEHLPKEKAIALLRTKPEKLVFVPLEDEFRENADGVASQEHQSKWTAQELRDLGLKVEVIKGFHRGVVDAAWATS